ncbi:short-chain collagen C4-like [Corticium candelabrum]|uniref:short-chain collagen C4-like n=1 Tax=Corticium candelabrum TaxID=121492 RepID=UPI002E25225B|nr:short-chain collagen C4-like [Corticium candelabrum]
MAVLTCNVVMFIMTSAALVAVNSSSTPTQKTRNENADVCYISGPRGPPGRDGLNGRDGIQGIPGIPGLPGRVGVKGSRGTTGTGSPGAPGISGNSGVPGKMGPEGRKGADGGKGEKGEAGRPANLRPEFTGTTYIQWGRKRCSTRGVQTLYSGIAAGSEHSHYGGGVNTQCLPLDPVWGYYKDGLQGASYIYGSEYELAQGIQPFINKGLHDYEVPCAVCYDANKNTQFMLAAKNICPTGWSRAYYGYLMAEHYGHRGRNMYVCFDHNAESTGSKSSHNGNLFYPVEAVCGSLPCPPYVNGRELTCAVCTK